ncbi:MAG TPA: hypothetical protein VLQ67_07680 [Arachnia sp.]|nr:hypothetical protein [Arachnia sp.]
MDDVIDLDATVEASWRTFQQEYAAALGELRPGEFLQASVDDGEYWMGGTPSVLAFAWVGEVGVVVEGNDVLACAYRLTRADMSALRKCGLRRFDRRSSAYRLVLPVSEAMQAADVAASVLRDVFSVIHPAFLKGGGFSICGRARSE